MRRFAVVFLLTSFAVTLSSCARQDEYPKAKIKDNVIKIKIADEPSEWRQGLSNQEKLAEDEGMLFIFPEKSAQNFWMKDMKFALDIIWIDGDRIVKISRDLPPEGEAPKNLYSSDQAVDRVLEVNAGWSDRHGVKEGDRVEL